MLNILTLQMHIILVQLMIIEEIEDSGPIHGITMHGMESLNPPVLQAASSVRSKCLL